jgi:hypothetical protein
MSRYKAGDTIVVWFSCGAASAVAAKKTIEKYGQTSKIHVVNNPVIEEHSDNRRFLKDVEKWLGIKIEIAPNPLYPNCSAKEIWTKRKFMSSPIGAPCTLELKKRARQYWEENNKVDWHVLGFTEEETNRYYNFIMSERSNVLPVLINAHLSKQDCFNIIKSAGIEPPMVYELGYPNANCIGCVKAQSPVYWRLVKKQHPEIFEQRAIQSKELGVRLIKWKGDRYFLDELNDNMKGRPIKNLNFECGIFCEENSLK